MKLDYIPNQFGQTWVASHAEARRGVHTPLAYIDINEGNRFDADLFAQIMYWHEPSIENGKPRLTQHSGGHLWLAKNHSDWLRETRIKNRTARQCLERLKSRQLIVYEVHGREGDSTPFMRVNWDEFERRMNIWLQNYQEGFTETEYNKFLALFESAPAELPANPDMPCQPPDMPFQPPLTSNDSPLSPDVIPNTETTAETTSKTTQEDSVAPSGATGNDQSALEEFIETLDMPEEKEPETPPAKQREPNPWYDAAFAVWGFTASRNTGMVNMLQGKAKAKQFKAYNIDPPLESPEKLLSWACWYKWVEQHGENLNMLEDQMKIQSSIGKWRVLGEPAPQVFEATPLFEAVRLKVFGIDDPNARGQQMENITSWLAGDLDGGVGKLSAAATPTQVAAFAGWYKATSPKASMPRDLEKFANSWRSWAKSRKTTAPKQQHQPTEPEHRKPTPEEWRAANEQLKAKKELEPVL